MDDWTALLKKMNQSKRGLRRDWLRVACPYQWQFATSCPCPPDTVVHVRGGWLSLGNYWLDMGEQQWKPEHDCDFSDAASINNYTGNFANADQYLGYILCYDYQGIWDGVGSLFEVEGSGTGFAQAGDAEQDIFDWLESQPVYKERFPLCAVVLRNNGITGVDGQVLAVDPVNRGRSYLWRDMRPRHKWPQST